MTRLSRRAVLSGITAGFVTVSGCTTPDDSEVTSTDTPGDVSTETPGPGYDLGGFDPDAYDIEFDRIVNAVEDLGMDPSGEEPIDDALNEAFETGTRIDFPPGDYTVAEEPPVDPPHNPSRFGLVGVGESHRDVQFHFPNAADQEGFWFVYQKGGEDILLANFSIQLTDDKRTSVSVLLDANDNGIAADLEWLGFVPPQNVSYGSLLRMNVNREYGATSDGVNIARRVTMGREGTFMGGHESATETTPGTTFMRHTPSHIGELRLEDVHFEQCGHNAIRSINNPGIVTVDGGTFLNNDVSSIRIDNGNHPTKDSLIEGARIVQDHSRLKSTGDDPQSHPYHAMGIHIDSYGGRRGPTIRDCDIEYYDISGVIGDEAVLWGVVRVTNTGYSNPSGFTMQNCRIINETKAQTFWVQSAKPNAIRPRGVTLENLDVKVTSDEQTERSVCEIEAGRDGSTISNCCIEAPNGSLDGIHFNNCKDILVENSNINVAGESVKLTDSDGDVRNISVDGSCENPLTE
ncbi:hypothetical protein [Halobellus marinus]|uniref:hypothetical protein n=1 Tax=Halobellus TaxID=1073986 RepID=UPI0028B0CAA8|nr:hypothetical protein [Halobellus sp. DFY28]